MRDSYTSPVAGIPPEELGERMKQAHIAATSKLPKQTGVILLMAFDFGEGGGVGYISNGHRNDCITMVREWLEKMDKLS
jgi:hypothetical protein